MFYNSYSGLETYVMFQLESRCHLWKTPITVPVTTRSSLGLFPISRELSMTTKLLSLHVYLPSKSIEGHIDERGRFPGLMKFDLDCSIS